MTMMMMMMGCESEAVHSVTAVMRLRDGAEFHRSICDIARQT